jgi:hypothetical protein
MPLTSLARYSGRGNPDCAPGPRFHARSAKPPRTRRAMEGPVLPTPLRRRSAPRSLPYSRCRARSDARSRSIFYSLPRLGCYARQGVDRLREPTRRDALSASTSSPAQHGSAPCSSCTIRFELASCVSRRRDTACASVPSAMGETRKLAAILVSDVVGYSRLAGADEDRILARLRTLRSDLIDPTVAVHHGRIVKRTGDGSIIEFPQRRRHSKLRH